MNNKYEDLLYRAGLTASGCLDKMDAYDQAAIMRLIQLTIRDCATLIHVFVECRIPASEYPKLLKSQYDLS
jgi:hypothetical protein